jgi:hypothetical protein
MPHAFFLQNCISCDYQKKQWLFWGFRYIDWGVKLWGSQTVVWSCEGLKLWCEAVRASNCGVKLWGLQIGVWSYEGLKLRCEAVRVSNCGVKLWGPQIVVWSCEGFKLGCEAVRAESSITFIFLNSTTNFVFRMEKHITFCEIGNESFVRSGVSVRSSRCLEGLYNIQNVSHLRSDRV